MIEFQGKVALVTGGTRGIGRACASILAECGARVAICGRTAETSQAAAAELAAATGGEVRGYGCDIASAEAVNAMVKAIEADLGPIAILVNNAGVTRDTLLMRMKDDDWNAVLNANLTGAFHCCRAVARGMLKERWGRIINLVYRAALLLRNHAGVRQGVRMRLEKHIPVAAGLAGGSGNAAAALIALNALWRMDLPEAKLAELALELGSDVPYCLQGGAKAATGRGECLEALPLPPPMWFVLVHPPIAVSTRSIYTSPYLVRNLEPALDGRTPSFRRALERLEAGDIAGAVFNRMETAAFRHYPPLQAIKERLLEAGCSAAAMSGSGPTMFGVCHSEAQAQLAASAFDEYDVTLARSKEHGVVCANRDKA